MIGVVIVNFNGKDFLKDCVNSVLKQTYKDFKIFLVDNNSSDISLSTIKKHKKLEVIKNKTNTGFSGGCNTGICAAIRDGAEYIALLNSDAFAESTWLQELFNKRHHGMVSGKTLNLKGELSTRGIVLHKFFMLGLGVRDIEKTKDRTYHPSGCNALFSRELILDVSERGKFFDEKFFLYSEDVDVGMRAIKKGWVCAYADKAVAKHIDGASGGRFISTYYSHRNMVWIWFKHMSKLRLLLQFPLLVLVSIYAIYINQKRFGLGKCVFKAKIAAIKEW